MSLTAPNYQKILAEFRAKHPKVPYREAQSKASAEFQRLKAEFEELQTENETESESESEVESLPELEDISESEVSASSSAVELSETDDDSDEEVNSIATTTSKNNKIETLLPMNITAEALSKQIRTVTQPQKSKMGKWMLGDQVIPAKTADKIIEQQAKTAVDESIFVQGMKSTFEDIKDGIKNAPKPPELTSLVKDSVTFLNKAVRESKPGDTSTVEVFSGMLESFNAFLDGHDIKTVDETSRSVLKNFDVFYEKPRNLDLCEYCSTTVGAESTVQALSEQAPWRIITFPHKSNPSAEVCFDIEELNTRVEKVRSTTVQGAPLVVSTSPAFDKGYFAHQYFTADEVVYIQMWHRSYQHLLQEMKERKLNNEQMKRIQQLGRRLFPHQAAHLKSKEADLKEKPSLAQPKSWAQWIIHHVKTPFRIILDSARWVWNHPWALQVFILLSDIIRYGICIAALASIFAMHGLNNFSFMTLFANQLFPTVLARVFIMVWRLAHGQAIKYLGGFAGWLSGVALTVGGWFSGIPIINQSSKLFAASIQIMPNFMTHKTLWKTGGVLTGLGILAVGAWNPILAPVLVSATNQATAYLKPLDEWAAFSAKLQDVWTNAQLISGNEVYASSVIKMDDEFHTSALAFKGPVLNREGMIHHLLDPSFVTKLVILCGYSLCDSIAPRGKWNSLCLNGFKLLKKIMGSTWVISTVTNVCLDLYEWHVKQNIHGVSCVKSLLPNPSVKNDPLVDKILEEKDRRFTNAKDSVWYWSKDDYAKNVIPFQDLLHQSKTELEAKQKILLESMTTSLKSKKAATFETLFNFHIVKTRLNLVNSINNDYENILPPMHSRPTFTSILSKLGIF
jgi:hypothetical protein